MQTVVGNQERDWVMKFLMRLNDSYKGLKAQILLIKPFPKLNEVYSIMQQEEKRRDISVDVGITDGMAMMTRRSTLREIEKNEFGPQKRYFCTSVESLAIHLIGVLRLTKINIPALIVKCQVTALATVIKSMGTLHVTSFMEK